MGIRFLCPNGHKLHVKAFLAGKRGICPRCSAKFVIPLESDPQLVNVSKHAGEGLEAKNQAADVPAAEASNPPPNVGMQSGQQPVVTRMPAIEVDAAALRGEPAVAAPESIPNPTSSLPINSPSAEIPADSTDPITEAPHAVWYVRPPSGGQYGPASGDIMRTWIAEGRVTIDSLVWREGWPEWKKAGPLFPGLLSTEGGVAESEVPKIVTETNQGSSAELYRRRSSNMTTLSLVVMLIIACLILFGALVYVVKYMN